MAQNRQGYSQKCIFLHWKKTSARSVPRDPLAAKRQTVHPNNQRCLLRCHLGLTALQRTPNHWSPTERFAMFLALLPRNFQLLFLWVRISGSSVKVSLCSAISSDVANAPTAKTIFVGSAFPSTFSVAFDRIVPGLGDNFLVMSYVQTVQFLIACLFVQVSHHHWSRATSATVDDCHNVCPHVCAVWKQVLLCCRLSLKICRTHGEESSKSASRMSLGNWSPVRFPVSFFEVFPRLELCARGHPFWKLSVETRFGGGHRNFFQLLVGHTKLPVFAIVPDLVPVQLHVQPRQPLLQSLRSRSVATLDPVRSSRADVSRRSAVSGFRHPSSLVLELRAPHPRSLMSNMTKFSKSRIGLALHFSDA